MTGVASASADHARLMDAVYRRQRHVYDATRRFFLFGRDALIRQLDCAPGDAVLEIACGTGRNLFRIGTHWPDTALHGLDISAEMLRTARLKLGDRAVLACGDATAFNPQELFGRSQFDRVIISYALSMIPDWQQALRHALELLAPRGELHIVDFGDFGGLPRLLRAGLRAWLSAFHVTPRAELVPIAFGTALRKQASCESITGRFDYCERLILRRYTPHEVGEPYAAVLSSPPSRGT